MALGVALQRAIDELGTSDFNTFILTMEHDKDARAAIIDVLKSDGCRAEDVLAVNQQSVSAGTQTAQPDPAAGTGSGTEQPEQQQERHSRSTASMANLMLLGF